MSILSNLIMKCISNTETWNVCHLYSLTIKQGEFNVTHLARKKCCKKTRGWQKRKRENERACEWRFIIIKVITDLSINEIRCISCSIKWAKVKKLEMIQDPTDIKGTIIIFYFFVDKLFIFRFEVIQDYNFFSRWSPTFCCYTGGSMCWYPNFSPKTH